MKNDDIVFMPYITTYENPSDEYNKFMKQYYENHKYCPKCGSTGHSSTYVGYILDMQNKDNYKDLNTCVCRQCGNVHTTHDRIKTFNYENTHD